MNDDWWMKNEWMIWGKDNSPTMKDKWVFFTKTMKEWLNDWNVIELFLLLSIEPIDYKLLLSKVL